MPHPRSLRLAPLLALLGFGCGDDPGDDPGDTEALTSSSQPDGSAGDGGPCIPGEEACECNDGECLGELACLSNVCVQLPTVEPPLDDGGDSGGPAPDSCVLTSECPNTDLCSEGECVDAASFEYVVTVDSFDGCPVDGFEGAEIYYVAALNGVGEPRSAASSCPAAWPDEPFLMAGTDTFWISFSELDAFFDDYISGLCWGDPAAPADCGPVPPLVLHEGTYLACWTDGIQYCAQMTFAPVPE